MSTSSTIGGVPRSAAPPTNRTLEADAALKKVAQQFEAVFVRQMMTAMRQAKLSDDILGSSSTDSFRDLADAKTADSIAAKGRFGIAALIERQFKQTGSGK